MLNLKKIFKKLKIKKGDNVYLSVNLGNVAKNYYDIKDYSKINISQIKSELSNIISNTLSDYIGKKGTIVCPSFTFSFCSNGFFDYHKSPSELGFFSEFFRKQINVYRSMHPINSVCARGYLSREITSKIGNYAFGANSPFGRLSTNNFKFINLGVSIADTITHIHHIEHLNGINHRYYKPFEGVVSRNNKKINGIWYSLVRYNSLNIEKHEYRIMPLLYKKKLVNKFRINNIPYMSAKVNDVEIIGLEALRKDSSYFANKDITIKFNEGAANKSLKTIKNNKIEFNLKLKK